MAKNSIFSDENMNERKGGIFNLIEDLTDNATNFLTRPRGSNTKNKGVEDYPFAYANAANDGKKGALGEEPHSKSEAAASKTTHVVGEDDIPELPDGYDPPYAGVPTAELPSSASDEDDVDPRTLAAIASIANAGKKPAAKPPKDDIVFVDVDWIGDNGEFAPFNYVFRLVEPDTGKETSFRLFFLKHYGESLDFFHKAEFRVYYEFDKLDNCKPEPVTNLSLVDELKHDFWRNTDAFIEQEYQKSGIESIRAKSTKSIVDQIKDPPKPNADVKFETAEGITMSNIDGTKKDPPRATNPEDVYDEGCDAIPMGRLVTQEADKSEPPTTPGATSEVVVVQMGDKKVCISEDTNASNPDWKPDDSCGTPAPVTDTPVPVEPKPATTVAETPAPITPKPATPVTAPASQQQPAASAKKPVTPPKKTGGAVPRKRPGVPGNRPGGRR